VIFVESEYATLRTVVLAESEVAGPTQLPDASELAFLTPEFLELGHQMLGKDHGSVFPERQRAWEKERSAFATVLTRHGVEVLRPRRLTPIEKEIRKDSGYANFFVRDPFFTVGPFVIEGSLRFAHRRDEILTVRPILGDRVYPADCTYVAVPRPELDEGAATPCPFLEGGDVLVLGSYVLVGTSGLASNELGARWLKKLLAPHGYHVELVRLRRDVLHLDCALGFVREGLVIVCQTALLDGIPQKLKTWERIDIDDDDARGLASNGLPISPDVYVTDPAFRHIGDRISDRGIQVEYVDFSITRGFGGSFRCSTQPLLRRTSRPGMG
jgi:N-dimethylarginine dimethylaminohydrolase